MLGNRYAKTPEIKTLLATLSFVSLAYGIAGFYRKNRADIGMNRELGITKDLSFGKKISRYFANTSVKRNLSPYQLNVTEELPHFHREDSTNRFAYLDVDAMRFPLLSGNDAKEVWSYDVDQTLLSRFTIYPLLGLYGIAASTSMAIVGYIAIAKDPAEPNYIAFKGTQGGMGVASALAGYFGRANCEWNTDMNNKLVDFYGLPGKAHQGFIRVVDSVIFTMQSILKQHNAKHKPLIVTGHSLGAAVASICAYYLRAKHQYDIQLYAYATPTIGNKEFLAYFDTTLADRVFSYHVKGDPVKFIPPRWADSRQAVEVKQDVVEAEDVKGAEGHYIETISYCLHHHLGIKSRYYPLVRYYMSDPRRIFAHRFTFSDVGQLSCMITGGSYLPERCLYNSDGSFADAQGPMEKNFNYDGVCNDIANQLIKKHQTVIEQERFNSPTLQEVYKNVASNKRSVLIVLSCALMYFNRTTLFSSYHKLAGFLQDFKAYESYLFSKSHVELLLLYIEREEAKRWVREFVKKRYKIDVTSLAASPASLHGEDREFNIS